MIQVSLSSHTTCPQNLVLQITDVCESYILFMRNGKWISTACRSWGRQVASFMLASLPIMFPNWIQRKLLLACNIQYLCMFVLLCYNKQSIDRTSLILVEHESSTLQIPKSNIRYDLEPVPSISRVLYFNKWFLHNVCVCSFPSYQLFQFIFQQPNTSSLVSVKCLIKFTTVFVWLTVLRHTDLVLFIMLFMVYI